MGLLHRLGQGPGFPLMTSGKNEEFPKPILLSLPKIVEGGTQLSHLIVYPLGKTTCQPAREPPRRG